MESLNLNNLTSLQVGLRITLGQKNGIFSQMCVTNVISNQERILLCKTTRTLIVVLGLPNSLYFLLMKLLNSWWNFSMLMYRIHSVYNKVSVTKHLWEESELLKLIKSPLNVCVLSVKWCDKFVNLTAVFSV